MADYVLHDSMNGLGAIDTRESAMITGDALDALKRIPDSCVQTIITSPPYWSLHDYGISGQIGLTEDIDVYIGSLADIFDEARRVLSEDGTL